MACSDSLRLDKQESLDLALHASSLEILAKRQQALLCAVCTELSAREINGNNLFDEIANSVQENANVDLRNWFTDHKGHDDKRLRLAVLMFVSGLTQKELNSDAIMDIFDNFFSDYTDHERARLREIFETEFII